MASGELADYILMKDMEQTDPATAKVCPVDPAHGRLSVTGDGRRLVCYNRIGQDEAKRLHEAGKPIAQLEGCKKFICDYTEPLSVG